MLLSNQPFGFTWEDVDMLRTSLGGIVNTLRAESFPAMHPKLWPWKIGAGTSMTWPTPGSVRP